MLRFRQLIAGQKEMVTHIGVVNDKTHEANKAAGKISEVVNLITEIASQTIFSPLMHQ